METRPSMATYEARLASFNQSAPTAKRRVSTAKGAKAVQSTSAWMLKSPTPEMLAHAGFYFKPDRNEADNVACFHCHKQMSGWEEEDDAVAEHLRLSPDCAWAQLAQVEKQVENGETTGPAFESDVLASARLETFGDKWPHESKRGWVPKVAKMVEAGWYYVPTEEGEDHVKCVYCNLSLDGWEPKDKPVDEHKRRSPDCIFFTLVSKIEKPAKAKKGSRPSKATRDSSATTQQTDSLLDIQTALNQTRIDDSVLDLPEEPSVLEKPKRQTRNTRKIVEDSISIQPDESILPGTKKAGKATSKAKSTRGKSRIIAEDPIAEDVAEKEDVVALEDNASIAEEKPEEPTKTRRATRAQKRTTEVVNTEPTPTESQPTKTKRQTRGKKRTSDEVDAEVHEHEDAPKAKRRVTAKRATRTTAVASQASQQIETNAHPDTVLSEATSTDLTTLINAVLPAQPVAKKPTRKPSTKRTSRARKASVAEPSIAIETLANTSPVDDVALDLALEADLDRPLSDDELQAEEQEKPKPRTKARKVPKSAKPAPVAKVNPVPIVEKEPSPPKPSVRQTRKSASMANENEPTATTSAPLRPIKEAVMQDAPPAAPDHHSFLRSPTVYRTPEPPAVPKHQTPTLSALREVQSAAMTSPSPQIRKRSRGMPGAFEQSVLSNHSLQEHFAKDSTPDMFERNSIASNHERTILAPSSIRREDEDIVMEDDHEQDLPDILRSSIAAIPDIMDVHDSHDGMFSDNDIYEKIEPAVMLPSDASRREDSWALPKPQLGDVFTPRAPHHAYLQHQPSSTKTRSGERTVLPPKASKNAPSAFSQSPAPFAASSSPQLIPSPSPSLQSSNAENEPPSQRPVSKRPPLPTNGRLNGSPAAARYNSPTRPQNGTETTRVPLAPSTPNRQMLSPSKRVYSKISTQYPWAEIEVENVMQELLSDIKSRAEQGVLSESDKELTLASWIKLQAKQQEEKFRGEAETLVSRFEREGLEAMTVLEGIVCVD